MLWTLAIHQFERALPQQMSSVTRSTPEAIKTTSFKQRSMKSLVNRCEMKTDHKLRSRSTSLISSSQKRDSFLFVIDPKSPLDQNIKDSQGQHL
ncbi:hypothetical protein CapIbe_009237 [Capra ibex]